MGNLPGLVAKIARHGGKFMASQIPVIGPIISNLLSTQNDAAPRHVLVVTNLRAIESIISALR